MKEENGPLSKLLRSYNLTLSELIPAANIKPSGSKAATGLPARCINPWQLADLRSHNRIVLSSEPLKNDSSVGDIHNVTTRLLCPRKYEMYLFSPTLRYRIISFSEIMICLLEFEKSLCYQQFVAILV